MKPWWWCCGFCDGKPESCRAVNENFLINSLVLCTCCHVLIVSNGCPKRIPQAPSKVFVVRRRKSIGKGKQKEGKVPNLLIYLMCVLRCCGKFFSVHPSANFVSIVLWERNLNKTPIAAPSLLHDSKVFTDGKHLGKRFSLFLLIVAELFFASFFLRHSYSTTKISRYKIAINEFHIAAGAINARIKCFSQSISFDALSFWYSLSLQFNIFRLSSTLDAIRTEAA